MTKPDDRSGVTTCPNCGRPNSFGAAASASAAPAALKPKTKAPVAQVEADDAPAATAKPRPSPAYQAMQARRLREASDGGQSFEKKALSKGALGGVFLCVIAVVWFFVGLQAGIIFFYPPILFCIGVYGIITGLYDSATGRGKGKRR